MPTYVYKAADSDGAIVEGKYLATNTEGVVKHLEQLDMIPVSIAEIGAGNIVERKLGIALFERINDVDRIVIMRNLAAAVKSGLDILQALDILVFDANKQKIRSALLGVKSGMQNGQPLSDALAAQHGMLPKVAIGMLRAGEASGKMGFTLDEISNNLSRDYGLLRKVKSAFAYPLLLLIASMGVVTLLLGFVLPKLQQLFAVSRVELPLVTRVLIVISNAFTWSPLLDLLILAAIITAFVLIQKSERGREMILRALFRTPIVREVMKKLALVRFTRTLGYMIASGTAITEALLLTSEAVGNPYYREAIREAAKELEVGISFSQTFEKYPELFPKFLISLVTVGEKTSTLETVLKTFANFYEEEVESALKDLTNVVEPLLLVIMGLIVGSVAMSILLPIYQLVGAYS